MGDFKAGQYVPTETYEEAGPFWHKAASVLLWGGFLLLLAIVFGMPIALIALLFL